MVQTVFVGTDVILDYLENRNQEVSDVIAQLLLLHNKRRIVIATSVFNVAEVIDKEFGIHFIGWCLNESMSHDEAINKLRIEEKLFEEISEKHGKQIEQRISNFILKNDVAVLSLSSDALQQQNVCELIYGRHLRSQDALMVATALANNVTYFLSNESNLVTKVGEMLDAYNLRDKNLRKAFRNDVVEAI